jgi:hypothetical protein
VQQEAEGRLIDFIGSAGDDLVARGAAEFASPGPILLYQLAGEMGGR